MLFRWWSHLPYQTNLDEVYPSPLSRQHSPILLGQVRGKLLRSFRRARKYPKDFLDHLMVANPGLPVIGYWSLLVIFLEMCSSYSRDLITFRNHKRLNYQNLLVGYCCRLATSLPSPDTWKHIPCKKLNTHRVILSRDILYMSAWCDAKILLALGRSAAVYPSRWLAIRQLLPLRLRLQQRVTLPLRQLRRNMPVIRPMRSAQISRLSSVLNAQLRSKRHYIRPAD